MICIVNHCIYNFPLKKLKIGFTSVFENRVLISFRRFKVLKEAFLTIFKMLSVYMCVCFYFKRKGEIFQRHRQMMLSVVWNFHPLTPPRLLVTQTKVRGRLDQNRISITSIQSVFRLTTPAPDWSSFLAVFLFKRRCTQAAVTDQLSSCLST